MKRDIAVTDASLRRIRARVLVTVEGTLSGVPTEDVRAALTRSMGAAASMDRVHLVEVGDVWLLGDAGDDVPATAGTDSFDESLSLAALAARQGVAPVDDFGRLLGDFWPADEHADDVIRAVKS